MKSELRAVAPIKIGERTIKPGDILRGDAVSEIRRRRLIAKGRASEEALENRAVDAGRPDLTLPSDD